MQCSLQNLFRAGLLLALLLSPERLTAQEPQGAQSPAAATEQPPAVPELADLIPLATALSGRLASLEKTIADGGDLSRVEQQLGEISALVDEYARQFLALKDSIRPAGGPTAATQSGDRECGRYPDRGQQIRDGKGEDLREPEKRVVG